MKKSKRKNILRMMLLALALALALTGCGAGTDSDVGDGGNSPLNSAEDITNMNNEDVVDLENAGQSEYIKDKITVAYTSTTSVTPWGTNNKTPGAAEVYERLFMVDLDGSSIPVLADATRGGNNSMGIMGFDHEDGSLEYTVYIWDYIYDHNGNHVTADDVAFSYNYQWKNETTTGWGVLESVEAVDETTVKFTLNQEISGYGEWERIFTKCYIVDQESYEASASGLLDEMCGTGPYKMVEYVPGSELILELNEDFWQTNDEYINQARKQNVQVIDYKFIDEMTTRVMSLKSGELDLSDDFTAAYLPDFIEGGDSSDKYSVHTYPTDLIYGLYCNNSEESICNDVNMRMAIYYALDTETFCALVGGTTTPALTFGVKTRVDYNPEWETMENYNTYRGTAEERAEIVKGYLEAAGYDGTPLTFVYQTDMIDDVSIMINMLTNAGININPQGTDHAGSAAIEADPTAWDMEYVKNGGTYVVEAWKNIFDWAKTADGDHSWNYIRDQELQNLLTTVCSIDGHTDENLKLFLERVYDNAYGINLYSATKSVVYSSEITYLCCSDYVTDVAPGGCVFRDPNA